MSNQDNQLNQSNKSEVENKESVLKKLFKGNNGGKMNRYLEKFNILFYLIIAVALVFIFNRFNFRVDLTKDDIFTLSNLSKSIVSELKDPLRIKVFISKNLPPPLNDLETSLRDLLEDYAEVANENFNFVFYDVTEKDAESSDTIKRNIAISQDYGIQPQQVQTVEKDEVKLVKVYLGIVVEYGDLIEKIPFVQSAQNLEFQLTTIFEKMNNKINTLLNLDENVKVTLFLEDNFVTLAPFFNIQGLDGVKEKLTETMKKVRHQNYDKVDFEIKSQLTASDLNNLSKSDVHIYPWNAFSIPNKGKFPAGNGVAAILVSGKVNGVEKQEFIELLRPENSLQLGPKGLEQVTLFRVINVDSFGEVVDGVIDGLLQVNDKIAYLKDKKTLGVTRQSASIFNPQGAQGEAENFFNLLNKTYEVDQVSMEDISTKYKSLVLAGAKEKFSDYDLFLIDQFLMSGKSLIVLHDTYFNDQASDPMARLQRRPPTWLPNDNGLADLLRHYGVDIQNAYIMDKKSYISRQQTASGGVNEQNIYFAPIIEQETINNEFEAISRINSIVAVEVSPIKLIDKRLADQNLKATRLFSSSKESWLMKNNIMLMPGFVIPPTDQNQYASYDFGYVVEGVFESYFKGKPIPVKEEPKKEDEGDGKDKNEKPVKKSKNLVTFKDANTIIEKSKPTKILVVSSSAMIKNNLIDQQGAQPNAAMMFNLIDYANDRGDWAIMRGKGQRANPLVPYKAEDGFLTNRDFLKFFNIIGLPVLIAFFGLMSFLLRQQKRKRIQQIYQ